MAEFISIETDFKDILEIFEEIKGASPKIQRSILAGLGSRAVSLIKKSYASSLKKRSGNLYKDIKRRVTRQGDAVVISSNTHAANGVMYGFALAKGVTITARKANYLTFKIDDKWIKAKSVRLLPRDWVSGPVESFIDSADYDNRIDMLIEREIKKLQKKGLIE